MESSFKCSRNQSNIFKLFLSLVSKWRNHLIHERQQRTITIQTTGEKPAYDTLSSKGILLAGEWVASNYALADAAAYTAKEAGQNISSALD